MHAADVAFWLAIKTTPRSRRRVGDQLDDHAFLGSASREALRCHARVLKLGRRLVYGCVECTAPAGRSRTTR